MEALSKLAAERRAAAQGIGVVALPNNNQPFNSGVQTFNLPQGGPQSGGISDWFEEQKAQAQHHRAYAIHQARVALPIPKPQTMANRLAAFQRVMQPSTRQRQRDALSIYAKPLTALAIHSANRFQGSAAASRFSSNLFGNTTIPLPESNTRLIVASLKIMLRLLKSSARYALRTARIVRLT
jgi:hypothetical protein